MFIFKNSKISLAYYGMCTIWAHMFEKQRKRLKTAIDLSSTLRVNIETFLWTIIKTCWIIFFSSQLQQQTKLTLTMVKYFCTNHRDQRVFSILSHHKCLISSFRFVEHLCYEVFSHNFFFILSMWWSSIAARVKKLNILEGVISNISDLNAVCVF